MSGFKAGELEVEAGAPILEQGAASPYLYTVLEGFGLRSKTLTDGRRQVISFVLPGDLIGLQTVMLADMDHSVEATTAMTLCVFSRERFWELFRASPSRAYAVSWLAAHEERSLGDSLTAVGQKTARERIATALVRFFRRAQSLDLVKKNKAPMPWRQRDLADALGLSLVHTNKTLKNLREQKLALWKNQQIIVPNLEELAEVGSTEGDYAEKRPLI